jgi:WD40 repeat protein
MKPYYKIYNFISQETMTVKFKATKCHDSALYKVKPLNEFLVATGDEDGTVKLWDSRQSNMSKPVMEDKQLDDAVTDIFYDINIDPKYMIVSSAEGVIQGRVDYWCNYR